MAFVARCGEPVDNKGAVFATGGAVTDVALKRGSSLKWDSGTRRFWEIRGEHDEGYIDDATVSELILSREFRYIHVHFSKMLDVDTLCRMLDTHMYEWVYYYRDSTDVTFFQAIDEATYRARNVAKVTAWGTETPVFTVVSYKDAALIGRIVRG